MICAVTTLRPRQNGRHFADDILKCIFWNENVWLPIKISLKFVPHGAINNIPALVQIMAWRRPGDKPLSGPMMVRLPTHSASMSLFSHFVEYFLVSVINSKFLPRISHCFQLISVRVSNFYYDFQLCKSKFDQQFTRWFYAKHEWMACLTLV